MEAIMFLLGVCISFFGGIVVLCSAATEAVKSFKKTQ
jgi:hypothetical protein